MTVLFAMLGSIVFETLTSPEALDARRPYDYPEHKIVEDYPLLQWTGNGLEEIRLEMLLHTRLGDPGARMEELRAVAAAHQALPLIFGNGYYRGDYVIAWLDESDHQRADDGSFIAIRVRMELRQYIKSTSQVAQPLGAPPALSPPASSNAGVSAMAASVAPAAPPTPTLTPGDAPVGMSTRS